MAEKRGEGEDSDKLLLKRATKKKVDYLLKKPRIRPEEGYNLVKRFFQAFTGKEYEFTREELLAEMDKVYLEESTKERVEEIIKNLGRVEFSNPQMSQDEIQRMLRDFSAAVDQLVHAETSGSGFWDSFVKRLKAHLKKHKKPEEEPEEEEKSPLEKFVAEADSEVEGSPEPESSEEVQEEREEVSSPEQESTPEESPEGEEPETQGFGQQQKASPVPIEESPEPEGTPSDDEFDDLLGEFYDHLDSDVMMAQLDYEELRHEYDSMPEDEQRKHYDALVDAYEALQEAK